MARPGNAPESSHKPLQRLLGRLEQQSRPGQRNEGLKHTIELVIVLLRHVCAVLDFTLLAEQALCKGQETRVQRAKFSEAIVAYEVDGLE